MMYLAEAVENYFRKVDTVNAETQTVIRVFPFILDEYTASAKVSSDKKMQTLISISPEQQNQKFVSLLKFTPFRDIQENCLKVIDLRRKVHLQFTPGAQMNNMSQAAVMFSLADDDGVGDICSDILHRQERQYKRGFQDASVQTDFLVSPHLLEDEQVADVFRESHSQTRSQN